MLLGHGDGTLQPHADYAVGSFPFGIAMGDLNGDGIPDLVVPLLDSSLVNVLLAEEPPAGGMTVLEEVESASGVRSAMLGTDLDFGNRQEWMDLVAG